MVRFHFVVLSWLSGEVREPRLLQLHIQQYSSANTCIQISLASCSLNLEAERI